MTAPPGPVILALGSNIEPERHLPAAVRELAQFGRVAAVSSVWQTEPAAGASGADFLNAALRFEPGAGADDPAAVLRTVIPAVESALGRRRVPGDPGRGAADRRGPDAVGRPSPAPPPTMTCPTRT